MIVGKKIIRYPHHHALLTAKTFRDQTHVDAARLPVSISRLVHLLFWAYAEEAIETFAGNNNSDEAREADDLIQPIPESKHIFM